MQRLLQIVTVQSERDNVFTVEVNNITLSSNDGKRMQSIDLIETYAYITIYI